MRPAYSSLQSPESFALLEELASRFQSASGSLERCYRELQERVQTLSGELEREREDRIRLERLAAMGEMAMELAHEIRNPLGSIELFASMTDGVYARQIVQSVRLLNHTVSNILQFGTSIHPVPGNVSFPQLIEGIRELLGPVAEQKQVRIETISSRNCTGTADYELLHRMLLNLALNAVRETPAGGRVRLEAAVQGKGIVLSVRDSGPGIPADVLPRIFDPMFSTDRRGSGLGLPIVKRIVESHGGRIDVQSDREGTTFRICLPNAAPEGAFDNTEVVSESPAGR